MSDFRDIAALGYPSLVPIIPPGAPLHPKSSAALALSRGRDVRGKAPGILRADGTWSGVDWMKLEATETSMAAWTAMGAGVGLRLGNGLYAVDFDLLDQDLRDRVVKLFLEHFPFEHQFRIGQAPKCLALLRCIGESPYRCVYFKNGQRVEGLGWGKQIVFGGIHTKTLKPYRWQERRPRRDELDETDDARLAAFFAAMAAMPEAIGSSQEQRAERMDNPRVQEHLRLSIDTLRAAVAAIPNTTAEFPTRDDYVKMGLAIKAAGWDNPQESLVIYEDWCARWLDPPSGAGEPTPVEDWMRMHPPFTVGGGWLLAKAARHGFERDASEFFAPIEAEATSIFDLAPKESIGEPSVHRTPIIETIDALPPVEDLPTRSWLISPWCPAHAVSMIVGAPSASKSAFVIRVAAAVASGGAISIGLGEVHRRGPVLIYNAEDDRAEMTRRLRGVMIFAGLDRLDHPLHLASGQDAKLVIVERKDRTGPIRVARGAVWLRHEIERLRPALVILDPLVSLSAGLDENSNADMEALLAELRAIASDLSVTMLVVHHAGKNADKVSGELNASRGASAIVAAVRGGLTLTVVKVGEADTDSPQPNMPAGRYVLAEALKANYGPRVDGALFRLKSVDVENGRLDHARLPTESAEAAMLARSGDTVAVHEIVDRPAAASAAKAARDTRLAIEAEQAARIAFALLEGDASRPLSDMRPELGGRLREAGLLKGADRTVVDKRLKALLGAGVSFFGHDGHTVRISLEKAGSEANSPTIIKSDVCLGGLWE